MTRASKSSSRLSRLIRKKTTLVDTMVLLDPEVRASLDDRSIAILDSAQLEQYLEQVLIHYMVSLTETEIKALFLGDAPMSSFSAKIKVARAFGIIGPKTRREFDTIREIRNVFAHARHLVSFETEEIKTACLKLTGAANSDRPHFSIYPAAKPWPPTAPRDIYTHSADVWTAALIELMYPHALRSELRTRNLPILD